MNTNQARYTEQAREELIGELRTIVEKTEEIFLRQGKQFPTLLSEMRRSLEHTGRLAECLQGRQVRGCPDEVRVRTVLDETRSLVDRTSETLTGFHTQDEQLTEALERGIQHLSSLEEVIRNIKDDSEEMELVSLNAMTVALKAGTAGRAFSYITEELKRLSTQTISLTDTITDQGSRLLTEFTAFRDTVEESQGYHSRLSNELRERLNECFDAFRRGVTEAGQQVEQIRKEAEGVEAPLNKIMETVQLQDVIKQSIDHVILALQELEEVDTPDTEEALLDQLSFFRQLPQLSSSLLGDIRERISESEQAFREHSQSARETIEAVEEARQRFVNSTLGSQEGSLSALFNDASEKLETLLNDLDEALTMKRDVADRAAGLVKQVTQLEENFRAFSSLVTRFHSIDVASRIEVAKQQVLQRMSGTVERMTDLTRRIESDVDSSLDATKQFIDETSKTMTDYRKLIAKEDKSVSSFHASMRERAEELSKAHRSLVNTISEFSAFTARFVELFDSMEADLGELSSLAEQIEGIRNKLGSLEAHAEKRINEILARRSENEWKIGNDRLRTIIDRFTIFAHKQTAGELGGFEVESGAQSGEVTLF